MAKAAKLGFVSGRRVLWPFILMAAWWMLALGVAGVMAWNARDVISSDGISYLDMADGVRDGNWMLLINGYWSPLYPLLLAGGLALFQPGPFSEFAAVHAINFAIFVAALASYEFFLYEAGLRRHADHAAAGAECLPGWVWHGTARALFLWTAVALVTTAWVTPDLCLEALVFLALGVLLRALRLSGGWRSFLLFGAILGLGYCSKAIFLPLSLMLLVMLPFLVGQGQGASRKTGWAVLGFVLAGAMYVAPLSAAKGRLSFGDAAKINYVWNVNNVPNGYWEGGPRGNGQPVHPLRRIADDPPVFAFDGPIAATMPLWFDPSYWFEGVEYRFDLDQQWKPVAEALNVYWRTFIVSLGGVWILACVSLLSPRGRSTAGRLLARQWVLFVPALWILFLYALVALEGRYIGPFVILICVAVLNAIPMPGERRSHLATNAIAAAFILVLAAKIGLGIYRNPSPLRAQFAERRREVARDLGALGVAPGDRIAEFGYDGAAWARLARVRIIAGADWWGEPGEEQFWSLQPAQREDIYRALARLGARGLVIYGVKVRPPKPDWVRLSDSALYWRPLSDYDAAAGP